jgi:hypothetical protein
MFYSFLTHICIQFVNNKLYHGKVILIIFVV